MKKTLRYVLALCIILFLFLRNCGFQVGNLKIGKQDSSWEVKQQGDFESSTFNKDYYSKDKLICLNLWATWCGPCIEEMPALTGLKNEFSGQDIAFVSLSVEKDTALVSRFLSKKKFDFHDISTEDAAYREAIRNTVEGREPDAFIGSQILPLTYLIKNKKILKKIEGQVDPIVLRNYLNEYK
jgi:thiol-disulfide isomerase/thioredoxin